MHKAIFIFIRRIQSVVVAKTFCHIIDIIEKVKSARLKDYSANLSGIEHFVQWHTENMPWGVGDSLLKGEKVMKKVYKD